MPSSQPLPPKENALFKRILKCYEQKQYKNGLKFAKQILTNPKYSEHGETLAMKGLTLNCLGRKEEAYDHVKRGLRSDLKSHVCWHVYGLLQRSDKKYDEAIKCYRNALKWDKENIQILRDLSLLQIQMRDLDGYRETRYQLLTLRPGQRASWIGYAISYHLLKEYDMAYQILEEFRKTQNTNQMKVDVEQSELLLYQNMVLRESGQLNEAIKYLDTNEPLICDKLAIKEVQGQIFIELGERSKAEAIYRDLIKRNPENHSYYKRLEEALGLTEEEDRLNLYLQYNSLYPRASAPKRLPLNFTNGERFSDLLDKFMRPAIRKGVPPLFNNLRMLYCDKEKVNTHSMQTFGVLSIHSSILLLSVGELESPSALLWTYFFLSQHYDHLRDTEKALDYINKAIDHTPTLIEAYMVKGRIYKHAGDIDKAAEIMDEARAFDTADRYVNCKCAKYQLRANQVQKAEDTCAMFTRDGLQAAENLNEMQCMWFQTECGRAYQRLGKMGEALKKAHEVEKHFEEITDDQFDFHTYCMRKMTLCAYIKLLRLEDVLRSHPFYFKAAKLAIECYVRLHDKPLTATNEDDDANAGNLSAKELKKLRSKQRRAEKKAQLQESKKVNASKDAEKKAEGSKESPFDPDDLARVSDPLDQALSFLKPLQQLASDRIETHLMAFEVFSRKGKLLLMLQSIKRAHRLDSMHPKLHECIVRFVKKVSEAKGLTSPVSVVIERELKAIVQVEEITAYNRKHIEKYRDSILHRLAGGRMMYHLDAKQREEALALVTDLSDSLVDRTLENCTEVFEAICSGEFGECEKTAQSYRDQCHSLFPYATLF
ncbi:predicted protein, partial [Nematostella vectensis]